MKTKDEVKNFFICQDGKTVEGPFTADDVWKMRFTPSPERLVCTEGTEKWIPYWDWASSVIDTIPPVKATPMDDTSRPPKAVKPPDDSIIVDIAVKGVCFAAKVGFKAAKILIPIAGKTALKVTGKAINAAAETSVGKTAIKGVDEFLKPTPDTRTEAEKRRSRNTANAFHIMRLLGF